MAVSVSQTQRTRANNRASIRYSADRLYCGIRIFGLGTGGGRSDKPAEPVVIIDYSANGLGVIAPFAPDKGQRLTLDLAGYGKSIQQLQAVVRNVHTISSHLHRLGIEVSWSNPHNELWKETYETLYALASMHGESAAVW